MSAYNTDTHRVPTPRLWSRMWGFVRPHRAKLWAVVVLNQLASVADVFSFTLLLPFLNSLFDQ